MCFRFLACALALVPVAAQAAPGDGRPQFTWQGEVDGTALLYVHRKRVIVENQDGGPVERQRYHIREALPASRQNVRLHVSEGRGYVHVVEQPRIDNDFTLAIAIEDRQQGSSFYSIAVDWDSSVFDQPDNNRRSRVKWSGRVEGHTIISCANARCNSQAEAGTHVMHERFKFTRPLPQREVQVTLVNSDGRGEVRLVEQPSETNGYTARVEISDPQGGADDYAFTLSWDRRAGPDLAILPVQIGFLWSGRVQGTVRVTLRGGASFSEAVSGAPVAGEQARFERPLPSKSNLKPSAKKREGQGTVDIVEYPSARNGYALVFEVRNTAPTADMYEVEVAW